MKITEPNQLKEGDVLVWPNGDGWTYGGCGADNTHSVDLPESGRWWCESTEVCAILSAVTVEREPEEVTFLATVRPCEINDRCGVIVPYSKSGDFPNHYIGLAPFIGKGVEVTVKVKK